MLHRASQFTLDKVAALAIRRNSDGTFHSGIFYCDEDTSLLLHLKGDEDLAVDVIADPYQFAEPGLDSSVRKTLAGFCKVIANEKPLIPFGIEAGNIGFGSDGSLINLETGKGLTCATFIVAVFESLMIPLIKKTEWPFLKDIDWQQQSLAYHFRGFKSLLTRAKVAYQFLGSPRFRPSEVVGASSKLNRPIGFVEAKLVGAKIERTLK